MEDYKDASRFWGQAENLLILTLSGVHIEKRNQKQHIYGLLYEITTTNQDGEIMSRYDLSPHDMKLMEVAQKFYAQDFNVSLALPGYNYPPKFDGCMPDVYAERGRERYIIEVETRESLRRDNQQHMCLGTTTRQIGAKFRIVMADE